MGSDKRWESLSIKLELIILVLINLAFYVLFAQIDFLEWLYVLSIEHEAYELDEIIPLFITLSISLSIFSYRRVSELRHAVSSLHRYATYDYLTGLSNRRHIMKIMHAEVGRSSRSNHVFSIILLDVDNFKAINDIYGHNAGDAVLTQLANILSFNVRNSDMASRWGGEEFLIFCPETELSGAEVIAEELLAAIRVEQFVAVNTVTVSMGVSSYKKDEALENLIHRADVCLYTAKEQGKDRYISD